MTSEGPCDTLSQRSRRYSTIKYSLSIAETLYCMVLLAVFQWSGFSAALARNLASVVPGRLYALPVYVVVVSVAYFILEFPFTFYHSFLLEHQFKLTRQSIRDWFSDQLKGGVIMLVISIAALEVFLYAAKAWPGDWWWITAGIWIVCSIAVTQLAPLVVIPLFFKYKEIADQDLRRRILALAARMKLAVLDVYEINLSTRTEKANAALVGLGRTRRVLVADTLTSKYTPEEIETIIAHEFAHQKSGHLAKGLAVNAAATVVFFFLLWSANGRLFAPLDRLENLPVFALLFMLFNLILGPAANALSRAFERASDAQAIAATARPDAFISAMEKLGDQNLADRDPHPVIKFIFFDHPSIEERITMARRQ